MSQSDGNRVAQTCVLHFHYTEISDKLIKTEDNKYKQRQCWEELRRLLPDLNALAAVSKGMPAVKLCSNKILQFLTGGATNTG